MNSEQTTNREAQFFMQRCLQLAANGLATTAPNPMVGAVVVHKGRIIGEGWHRQAGLPHAEPQAIAHSTNGKLNVKGVVGNGELTVVKDLGLKEPYVGTCKLVSGEIAEDLTYYYAMSEQTPTVIALGVLMNKDNTVRRAGGFMVQLMPDATDEIAEALENIVLALPPITSMLDEDEKPEQILEDILNRFGYEELERRPVRFRCDCSKERIGRALAGLNKYDLLDLMLAQEDIEVRCDYCNTAYTFSRDEMKSLYKKFHRPGKDEDSKKDKKEDGGNGED